VQQRFMFKSYGYTQKTFSTFLDPIENDRFIPNIDDEGNIDGSFVLINKFQSNSGTLQITKNINILEKFCSKQ